MHCIFSALIFYIQRIFLHQRIFEHGLFNDNGVLDLQHIFPNDMSNNKSDHGIKRNNKEYKNSFIFLFEIIHHIQYSIFGCNEIDILSHVWRQK